MKPWILGLDVGVVLGFVIVGKDSHGLTGDVAGVLETAAPFLIALGAGWLATRAWQHPASMLTGLGVLAVTVVFGVILRRTLFEDGTAFTFVLVATAFLTLGLLGWRAVVALLQRRTVSPSPES